jgi:predicted 2-oxoglutarate/Fe(II)-dependent dioxygenase YbiX
MNKNIEYYVYHKENFLEKSYCEDVIDELNTVNWEKHFWYNDRTDTIGSQFQEDTEPDILEIPRSKNIQKINQVIIQRLNSNLLEYVNKFKFDWFIGWGGYTSIRFNRYYPGQTMRRHCDHIHDMFDGERKGIPILSIVGILNDDYEGGELIMFVDKIIDTKGGDLLIFPSNFLYPHEIAPVTKGVRYSYVSWVW